MTTRCKDCGTVKDKIRKDFENKIKEILDDRIEVYRGVWSIERSRTAKKIVDLFI